MKPADRVKLLYGPYTAPPLKPGDRATCLYRDCDVVVTSWTDARIPWPRCRALRARGDSGLLFTDELVRAVRSESAAALRYWFGVGVWAVWRWGKALAVPRASTDGSRRLIRAAAEKGAARLRGKRLPAERAKRWRLGVPGRAGAGPEA